MAQEIGGVKGVLGELLTNDEPRERESRKAASPKGAARKVKQLPSEKNQETQDRTLGGPEKTRRGRPLGRKNGKTPPKEKATLWLPAGLIARYRDWSWEERCNIGELVERALVEYQRRHDRKKMKLPSVLG